MRIALGLVGLLMLLGGLGEGCSKASMNTAIGDSGREINNIGLIAEKEAGTTLGGAVAIVGAVFFAAASIMDLVCARERQAEKLAGEEKEERGAMLRTLERIAAEIADLPAAPPVRAPPKRPVADPAFDAAIAADLRKPLR